jgi:hypothetical protein
MVNTLGITSALDFELLMCRNGFGPDILHLVDDQELTEMGMRKGDVICLEAGAQSWWNGPKAKKHVHSEINNQGVMPMHTRERLVNPDTLSIRTGSSDPNHLTELDLQFGYFQPSGCVVRVSGTRPINMLMHPALSVDAHPWGFTQ